MIFRYLSGNVEPKSTTLFLSFGRQKRLKYVFNPILGNSVAVIRNDHTSRLGLDNYLDPSNGRIILTFNSGSAIVFIPLNNPLNGIRQ